jgi:hypothetical protein
VTAVEEEFVAGYTDGRDPSIPDAGQNRSDAYLHSFAIGRAELDGRPIAAAVSRARVAGIMSNADCKHGCYWNGTCLICGNLEPETL